MPRAKGRRATPVGPPRGASELTHEHEDRLRGGRNKSVRRVLIINCGIQSSGVRQQDI